jgi:hypothetical protein
MSLWLLNLGSMLAGQYPDSIPLAWRIPPEALEAEADIGRLHDVAADLGVDAAGLAGGAIMEDLDGDGDLDLMASSSSLSGQLLYFRNDQGSFVESSAESGLTGLTGGLNLIQADYDNDGDVDVLVLRGGWNRQGQPNSLLRNDGSGRFEDVTESAGMLASHPTQTGAWGDYDGDGLLDLFIGNESRPDANPPQIHTCELYRNNGDGSFTNVAAQVGLDVIGFVKAAVWGDYDNDGRIDLYLSRFGEPNLLLWNGGRAPGGEWRFEDHTAEAGIAAPVESFPAWFWDYDNDGWLDLFVSGYRLQPADIPAEYLGRADGAAFPRLYRNTREGGFEDVTRELHLDRVLYAMGANFGDLDNDGWLDIYVGTGEPDYRALVPNRVFRSAGGERFLEVTSSGGFGHLGKGHGVAFGDLDGDGDQDIYQVIGGAREGDVGKNILFENPGHGNRWLTLRLEGVRANRSGIGARVTVRVETPDGPRAIHRLVGSGGSFGASSLQLEIGLGNATALDEIEIRWPGGESEVHRGLFLDRVYRIVEGDAVLPGT